MAGRHLKALLVALLTAAGAAAVRVAAQHPEVAADTAPGDLVVLVHGMGRTPLSMLPLELFLERSGYRVLNFGYSSYGPGIVDIARRLDDRLALEVETAQPARIHFVGHSLGNIIIRALLADEAREWPVGRVVMLAPPNQGSASADRMAPYVGWLLRPIGELRTRDSTVLKLQGLSGIEFAIVAGKADGKVSVAETCLSGAKAHLLVSSAHTFIMIPRSTHELIRGFLDRGEVGENVAFVPPDSCLTTAPPN